MHRLGPNASAGTTAEAAQADLVILAVGWDQVLDAVRHVPDWNQRIVIDVTNQWQDFGRGIAADLGEQTGSERNAALMPGRASSKPSTRSTVPPPRETPGTPMVALLSFSPATTKTPRQRSQRSSPRRGSPPLTSASYAMGG